MPERPDHVADVRPLGIRGVEQSALDEPVREIESRGLRLQFLERRGERSTEQLVVRLAVDAVFVRRTQVVRSLVQHGGQRQVPRRRVEPIHRGLAEQRRSLLAQRRFAVGIGVQIGHRNRAPAGLRDRAPVRQRLPDGRAERGAAVTRVQHDVDEVGQLEADGARFVRWTGEASECRFHVGLHGIELLLPRDGFLVDSRKGHVEPSLARARFEVDLVRTDAQVPLRVRCRHRLPGGVRLEPAAVEESLRSRLEVGLEGRFGRIAVEHTRGCQQFPARRPHVVGEGHLVRHRDELVGRRLARRTAAVLVAHDDERLHQHVGIRTRLEHFAEPRVGLDRSGVDARDLLRLVGECIARRVRLGARCLAERPLVAEEQRSRRGVVGRDPRVEAEHAILPREEPFYQARDFLEVCCEPLVPRVREVGLHERRPTLREFIEHDLTSQAFSGAETGQRGALAKLAVNGFEVRRERAVPDESRAVPVTEAPEDREFRRLERAISIGVADPEERFGPFDGAAVEFQALERGVATWRQRLRIGSGRCLCMRDREGQHGQDDDPGPVTHACLQYQVFECRKGCAQYSAALSSSDRTEPGVRGWGPSWD